MRGRHARILRTKTVSLVDSRVLAFMGCLLFAVTTLHAATPIALFSDGRAVAAVLRGVAKNGAWIFDSADESVVVNRDQLVLWGAYRDRPSRSWVLLSDGSLLVVDLLGIEKNAVVVAGRMWPETRLPRSLVRAILFRPPLDSLARDTLVLRAFVEQRTEDHLLFEHGDELRGRVPDMVKPEPGAFHPEKIRWALRGSQEPVALSLQRVTALLFAADRGTTNGNAADRTIVERAGVANATGTQWVGLRDGSRLLVTDVTRSKDALTFTLAAGNRMVTEAELSGANPFDAVVFLQPIGTDIRYLSELEPVGYKHIPFFASSWPYHRDRSTASGQLRCNDDVFLKGLGMHSSSRLAFDLPKGYHLLQAELAIDQRAGRSGSVVFRVYLQDNAGRWAKAFESDVVRGGQHPIPMRVDVQNAVRIALIVDFADRADQWDHANWLNARLTR